MYGRRIAVAALLLFSIGCGGGDEAPTCAEGEALCGEVCVVTSTDVGNCGACGNACPAGQACVEGQCEIVCPPGQTECDGACFSLESAREHCGACGTACGGGEVCVSGACASSCAPGTEECDGTCHDLSSDRAHCGACGNDCGADELCVEGMCQLHCAAELTDCDGTCRDTNTDRAHCGACGNACGAEEICQNGACVLSCGAFAPDDCNGACTNVQVDPMNCGTCGNACAPGEVCSGGTCATTCAPTLDVCSGQCTSTDIDPANCGTCGNACTAATNASAVCVNGGCDNVCFSGYADCDADLASSGSNGCEIFLQTDPNHCGACGNACSAPANGTASCVSGSCAAVCNTGFDDCDGLLATGCETDLTSDAQHCGACNNPCAAGYSCVNSACVFTPGPAENCSLAVDLFPGPNVVTWTAGTNDYVPPAPSCMPTFTDITGPDLVFRYTPTISGYAELVFDNKPTSTRWIAIVSDGACGTLTPELTCISDWSPAFMSGSVPVTAGTPYYVYVIDTESGSLPLSNPISVTINELDCSIPTTVTGMTPAPGTTTATRTPTLEVAFERDVNDQVGTVTLTGDQGTNLSFTLPNAAVTAAGSTLTIDPGLTFPSGETVTVTWTGLTDLMCGTVIPAPAWTFDILDCGTDVADVVSSSPAPGTITNTLSPELTATFDLPINGTAGTVTVTGDMGTNLGFPLPSANVALSPDGLTMTIDPGISFPPGEAVTVSWTGLTDAECMNAVPAPAWNFGIIVPSCTPGVGGMVGTTITRIPTTISSITEYYVAADTNPNGYVYVGGTTALYRVPKAGGPTEDVEALAGLSTSHIGYGMLVDGQNIYTVDSKATGTTGFVYRISSDGGATWNIQDAVTFPSTPGDEFRGIAAYNGRIYLVTQETSLADTEIWSFDATGTLPATAQLERAFGNGVYEYCGGLAVDASYFYTRCRSEPDTSVWFVLRIDRTTGAVTEINDTFDGSTVGPKVHVKDQDADGLADFLYTKSQWEDGQYMCAPGGSTFYADEHYSYGTGSGSYGLGFDPVQNALWAFDDDTYELVKIQ